MVRELIKKIDQQSKTKPKQTIKSRNYEKDIAAINHIRPLPFLIT